MPNQIIVTVKERDARLALKNVDEEKAQEFSKLVQRVYKHKPDPKDITELKNWLDTYPDVWRVVFNMSSIVEKNLINRIVADEAAQLAIEKNADEIRSSLGYEKSPAMEKLLVDNIVIAWLRKQWIEYQLILMMGQSDARVSVLEFWEKRLSLAQNRFLRACETLEKIRKLSNKNPTLQVNIATQNGQQVNVAGNIAQS